MRRIDYSQKPKFEYWPIVVACLGIIWAVLVWLIVLALLGCTAKLAMPDKSIPVSIVTPIPHSAPGVCELPPLPPPVIIVGWPSPSTEHMYVTKTDLIGFTQYEALMNQWAHMVAYCLLGRFQAEGLP